MVGVTVAMATFLQAKAAGPSTASDIPTLWLKVPLLRTDAAPGSRVEGRTREGRAKDQPQGKHKVHRC